MTILIPNDIKSNFHGYDFIISLSNTFRNLKNTKIKFDFQNVRFFEANLCAILGSIIEFFESNGNVIEIINTERKVEQILRKNGFLSPFGFTKLIDRFDTSLTYKKFTADDDKGFNDYIQNELLSKSDFPSHSPLLGKEILKNIFEMYENARTHGECDYIHTCGQFYPKAPDKPLLFTIVDKGINIKQNVSSFLKKEMSAPDAIEWAMIKGNTTKTGSTSGGLGLAIIFEFITLNKGKIQVVSSNGFYEYYNGQVNKKTLTSEFDGTIINIRFNLNDVNHYRLTNEVDDDFENIF